MSHGRRIWMINGRFQWAIVGYTVGISVGTTCVHYLVERIQLDWPAWLPVMLLILFNTAVVIFAMWISHRVAGPLWRLRNVLRDGAVGKPLPKLYFRRWDYFKDVNEAYNAFVDSLPPERQSPPRGGGSPGGAGPDKTVAAPLSLVKNQQGMTLIEALVVVAIVGIMVSLSAVMVTRPKEDQLFKQDVGNFLDALLSARNAAFTRGECAQVILKTPTNVQVNTYPVTSPCTGIMPAPDYQTSRDLMNSTVANFSDANGPTNTLTFNPRGGTLSNGPATVVVTASLQNHRTQRFTIYPAIGQIRQE